MNFLTYIRQTNYAKMTKILSKGENKKNSM